MRLFIPLYETRGMTAFVVAGHSGSETLPVSVVTPCQTHSLNVARAVAGTDSYPDTDALLSFEPSLLVGVRTADCVPVLLFAPDIKAVAAAHAGWRGSLHGIVDRTVASLVAEGADPAYMTAIFGPSICCECYEVSPELADEFAAAGFAHCLHAAPSADPLTHRPADPSRPHLDLEAVNRTRLMQLGLQPGNIVASTLCTRHSVTLSGISLPSYRRNGTSERLISCIALTDE